MRVLVVEDDVALALFLQKGLKIEGHEVDCVGDGEAAIDYVQRRCVDLMVLDLSLPRRDGMEVLKVVRERCPDTAVVVLTGRSEMEHRVHCLNAGADDYLQKPFSFHELTARCRAILRRQSRFASPLLEFGGIRMNLLERAVCYSDVTVELTAKEFMVLEVLMRRRGECITRAELLAAVWPGVSITGMNVVDVYVTYLRRKFAAVQRQQGAGAVVMQVIETVRGAGYKLSTMSAPIEQPMEAYGS